METNLPHCTCSKCTLSIMSFMKRSTYNGNITLAFFRRSFCNSASGENVFLCEKNNQIDFSNNCISLNLSLGFM